jgi:hypothetical protein
MSITFSRADFACDVRVRRVLFYCLLAYAYAYMYHTYIHKHMSRNLELSISSVTCSLDGCVCTLSDACTAYCSTIPPLERAGMLQPVPCRCPRYSLCLSLSPSISLPPSLHPSIPLPPSSLPPSPVRGHKASYTSSLRPHTLVG